MALLKLGSVIYKLNDGSMNSVQFVSNFIRKVFIPFSFDEICDRTQNLNHEWKNWAIVLLMYLILFRLIMVTTLSDENENNKIILKYLGDGLNYIGGHRKDYFIPFSFSLSMMCCIVTFFNCSKVKKCY